MPVGCTVTLLLPAFLLCSDAPHCVWLPAARNASHALHGMLAQQNILVVCHRRVALHIITRAYKAGTTTLVISRQCALAVALAASTPGGLCSQLCKQLCGLRDQLLVALETSRLAAQQMQLGMQGVEQVMYQHTVSLS